MRNVLMLGAAAAAGLAAFAGAALAQPARTEGDADVSASTDSRGRLAPGESLSGRLDPAGDSDWYRIRLREGRTYRFTLNGDGEDALGDPVLNLYGAGGGDALATNDDSGGSLNSALSFTPTRSGNYFLGVTGFGGEASGRYVLAASQGGEAPRIARIAVGDTVNGTIANGGERLRYRIDLVGGQTYRFSLNKAGDDPLSDPYLSVLAGGGEGDPLASDDDSGGELNSYLEFTAPETGAYVLQARGFSDSATGGFQLVTRAGDVPADANTDVSIAPGESHDDRLNPAGDSDWFRLELTEGQTVRIRLNSGGGDPVLNDPMVVIHGPDGAELVRNDDGGEGLNSYIEFAAPSAGAYFVEARGFSESAVGGYVLSVSDGEIPGAAETDETLAIAEPRESRIGAAGDADWFRVSLVEGRTYRFNLESAGEPALDPVLTLMDPEGAKLVEDDDGGTGANSYITYTAPKNGDYFAAVAGFDGQSTGAYTLRVADFEVPRDQGTDESLQGDEDSRTSRIDFADDNDAFRVSVQPGQRYRIEATGVNPGRLAAPRIVVLRESGGDPLARGAGALTLAVPQAPAEGAETDERHAHPPAAIDSVLVVVSSATRGGTGAYSLTVRKLR